MTADFGNHPCFNAKIRHQFGRVHLPVAPRCNIQCKFCNRKFDCVNESRPGVSSGILSPYQALVYLEHVFEEKKNISVVGIAGPGDPFANPEETMETLRLVRAKYPDILLCLASNGLGIGPYIPELAALKVGHVTITVNAIDPEIASQVYAWVRYGKKVLRADAGVKILLEKQIEAIKELKKHGVTVKVNSIVIPGINDFHIVDVAKRMAELDVDIFNCLPYYQNEGSAFSAIPEPSAADIKKIREEAGKYVHQMTHCARCRADAVGCIGEKDNEFLMSKLQACESMPKHPDTKIIPLSVPRTERTYIAVASLEGALVNQHLGEAFRLLIFGEKNGGIELIDERLTPEPGGGDVRWEAIADLIKDCRALLVSGIGKRPETVLRDKGIQVLKVEGLIEEAAGAVFRGDRLNHIFKRERSKCGVGCSGGGMGCG
ncbi:MAG: nitrogenase cofactor biosynthesis protein NifB [Proteobacteria bacterium]|nr:nitrogenase cofactor biosynthesis protein NifB [Pseudomonadota bacterium]